MVQASTTQMFGEISTLTQPDGHTCRMVSFRLTLASVVRPCKERREEGNRRRSKERREGAKPTLPSSNPHLPALAWDPVGKSLRDIAPTLLMPVFAHPFPIQDLSTVIHSPLHCLLPSRKLPFLSELLFSIGFLKPLCFLIAQAAPGKLQTEGFC